MAWRDSSRRRYFQRHWMKFFRPEEDLHPLVQAWKTQVRRSRETSRNSVKVEKLLGALKREVRAEERARHQLVCDGAVLRLLAPLASFGNFCA